MPSAAGFTGRARSAQAPSPQDRPVSRPVINPRRPRRLKTARFHGPFSLHAGRETVPCSSAAASRKPNPVTLRLGPGSSNRPGGLERAALVAPPYLVLLRAGFCLPPALPRARCALTAPFHPYPRCARLADAKFLLGSPGRLRVPGSLGRSCAPGHLARHSASVSRTQRRRYIFCATFLQVTLTGRYPAHCPAEFGLSSLPGDRPSRAWPGNSGRLADCGGSRAA